MPRWSVDAPQEAAPLNAGLPGCGWCVCVNPPLLASAPSSGLAGMIPFAQGGELAGNCSDTPPFASCAEHCGCATAVLLETMVFVSTPLVPLKMPPPAAAAWLSVIVEWLITNVCVLALMRMPPPKASPLLPMAWLPLTVEFVIEMAAPFWMSAMPPPSPLPPAEICPRTVLPAKVLFRMVTAPVPSTDTPPP